MDTNSIVCKICNKPFDSEKGLHIHLKSHSVTMAEYYTTYYPRSNLLTGEPLPFKNKKDYFNNDFSTRWQMVQWLAKNKRSEKAKQYAIKQLSLRVIEKGLKRAPNHLELEILDLPPIDSFKMLFGSYSAACDEIGVRPIFTKRIPKEFFIDDFLETKIFIDTREQKPLSFKNESTMKLDFGDYTAAGDDYAYTYVDRKSEQDFKSTMTTGFDRFKKELDRTRDFGCYMFVVVESSIDKIKRNNNFSSHKSNLKYVWHNMRVLTHEYAGVCQFIFSGSRSKSEEVIPKIVTLGDKLWDCDMQYYIDKSMNNKGES